MIISYIITPDLKTIATINQPYIAFKQSVFHSKCRKPSNHPISGVKSSGLGGRIGPKAIPAWEDHWVYMSLKFGKRRLK